MGLGITAEAAGMTALLVAPNRELARQFAAAPLMSRAFQVLADLKTYPQPRVLDVRLRQLSPDVLLLDLSSDFERACELIRCAASFRGPVHVVGLHTENDPAVILESLNLGATEYLSAPFDSPVHRDALARLERLCREEARKVADPGRIVSFTSAKPGAGSSTLAVQTALALRNLTGRRVLLADLDLMGGTAGFCLGLQSGDSLLDILDRAQAAESPGWPVHAARSHGLDVLPAPRTPRAAISELNRLHEALDGARAQYEWVVLDLPVVFQRLSLLALTESDRVFLVATPELPGLHLARKAVTMLRQAGFARDRIQILVNRMGSGEDVSCSDVERMLDCSVFGGFPNDSLSLHRSLALGQPLGPGSGLGKTIEDFAAKLCGACRREKGGQGALMSAEPALVEG